MADPILIEHDVFQQGESYSPVFLIQDADEVALDLSSGTVEVTMRLMHRNGGTAVTRKLSVAGQTSFPGTAGTDGQIAFHFTAAETAALTAGLYRVAVVYEDTGPSPDAKVVKGHGWLQVREAQTGTL